MKNKLREYEARREHLEQGGGPKRIASQHEKGKLTARERLDLLFDDGTFTELGLFVQHRATDFGVADREAPADAVVTGFGRVDGRPVYAFAQDFTVIGGTLGEMHAMKIAKVMDMALQNGAPLVGINDSGGARIQEGIDALNGFGEIFRRNTMASGVIPQLSVIMGPCAGGAVYSPALTDFVLMVEGTSQMFITGPQVIETVTGESISLEALGGASAHSQRSGVAHLTWPTEQEVLFGVRRLLSFMPSNNLDDPPILSTGDPRDRRMEEIVDLVPVDPNRPYDVKTVVRELVDEGDFFELQPSWAQNVVVGFARLAGRSVGIVANQPKVLAGCLDVNAGDKVSRFVRVCDAFNVPVITLVDTPGFLPGVAQEHGGIIRHGAKILYAYSEATVPKLSVIMRKAYGGAYIAMCSRSLGADVAFAWPTAEVAVMGPEGAANIVFRRELADAENPEERRRELVQEYRERFANPYVAAARGYIDRVIDPCESRYELIRALEAFESKREERPGKKHGNIPM